MKYACFFHKENEQAKCSSLSVVNFTSCGSRGLSSIVYDDPLPLQCYLIDVCYLDYTFDCRGCCNGRDVTLNDDFKYFVQFRHLACNTDVRNLRIEEESITTKTVEN